MRCSLSHPVWVRGLKHQLEFLRFLTSVVAPRVGAWIETPTDRHPCRAPPSHPVWVRGLKHRAEQYRMCHQKSHPVWVRGLKLTIIANFVSKLLSHPVWVRGLKLPRQND